MTDLGNRDTTELVAEFERLAKELTRRTSQSGVPTKAGFPKSYIRPLWKLRDRWPYLPPDKARTAACVIQLSDVNRWNLNMWDIRWTAGDLCEWQATVPLIAVAEMLMVEHAMVQAWATRRPSFKDAILLHEDNAVIDDELARELEVLRSCRNEIHLYLKEKVAIHDGRPSRYNRAVVALQRLEEQLAHYWETNPADHIPPDDDELSSD